MIITFLNDYVLIVMMPVPAKKMIAMPKPIKNAGMVAMFLDDNLFLGLCRRGQRNGKSKNTDRAQC